jgi:hypothetical protein
VGVAGLLRVLFAQFGAELPAGPLVLEPRTVVVSVVVGLLVTVVSAYLPARRAAVIPPVAALREEVSLPVRSLRVRTVLPTALPDNSPANSSTQDSHTSCSLTSASTATMVSWQRNR